MHSFLNLSIVLSILCCCQEPHAPASEQDAQRITYISNGFETKEGIQAFFGSKSRSDADLSELKFDTDPKIWIVAAWIHCKLNFGRIHGPTGSGLDPSRGEEKWRKAAPKIAVQTQGFLGFISGKLNVELPDWWMQEMQAEVFYLGVNYPSTLNEKYSFVETLYLNHRTNIKILENTPNSLSGTVNGIEFRVPWVFPEPRDYDDDHTEIGCIDIIVAEDGSIFFACAGISEFVQLQYFDKFGILKWTVLSDDRGMGGNFESTKFPIQIIQKDDVLYLFGACVLDRFLHCYSCKDGELLMKFSTFNTFDLPFKGGHVYPEDIQVK